MSTPHVTWFDSTDFLAVAVDHVDPPGSIDADPSDRLTIATPDGPLLTVSTLCGDDVTRLVVALRFAADKLEAHAGARP